MHFYALAGLWALAAYAIYYVANKIVVNTRHAGKPFQRNCC